MTMYRKYHFWALYPTKLEERLVLFCIFAYFMMYLLQLFWFSKMIYGLCKIMGLDIPLESAVESRVDEGKKTK